MKRLKIKIFNQRFVPGIKSLDFEMSMVINMIERENQTEDYVGYEYKKIMVEQDKLAFYLDAYKISDEKTSDFKDIEKNIPRLKRNRKIINKTELTRLQRHFEDCVRQIDQMERQKTQMATMIALGIGIVGTAFITGQYLQLQLKSLITFCVKY